MDKISCIVSGMYTWKGKNVPCPLSLKDVIIIEIEPNKLTTNVFKKTLHSKRTSSGWSEW